MAVDRHDVGFVVLRIFIGVFFIFEGLGKVRWFADTSVLAGRFAESFGLLGKVENVVLDLEGETHLGGELPKLLDVRLRSAPQDGTHLGRAGKERGSLPIDAANVCLDLLVGLVRVKQLEQLAVAELAERRGKNADYADIASACRQHRRLREEEVTDQNRRAGGHY